MSKVLENQPFSSDNGDALQEASASDVRTSTDALTTDAGEGIDMADSKSTRSPAFQFYPKDFLEDEHVALMSMQERGIYITLLCKCWNEGSIPVDPRRLAKLCGISEGLFRRVWSAVLPCFRSSGLERLVNPRLERERRKQREYRKLQSEKGKLGGRPKKPRLILEKADTKPAALTEKSSSSSSSSASSDFSPAAAESPNARSKRPIYTSDRFAVFEWQLDDLSKMLGKHFESFDLHAFFDALSQQSRESGLVIARADVWPWLQAQVLAEARRRGLPLASGSAASDRAAERRAQDERIVAQLREVDARAGR